MTPEDEQRLKEDVEELHMEIGALQDEVAQLRAEMDHKDASGLSLYIATLEERQKALDFFIADVEAQLEDRIETLTRVIRSLEEQRAKDGKYYSKVIIAQQSAIDELQCAMREKKKKGGKA